MTSFAPKIPAAPVADKDRAETFKESDVTVSSSAGRVSNGSVEIGSTGPSRPGDNNSFSASEGAGLVINPNNNIGTIDVEISSNVGTVTEVFVTDTSVNKLDSVTGTFGPGDVVRLSASLSSGTDYYVMAYDGGNSYQLGFYNSSVTTSGGDLDIVSGVRSYNGAGGTNTTTGEGFNIVSIKTPVLSASATVEWPDPVDIYAWDTAVYQATPDGETVEVYIEENQSGGWTEVSGPISRGDAIPADPSNNVRYRIELSRSNTTAKPTLDAIYRRFKL